MLNILLSSFIYFPNIASKSDDQQGKWDLPDWRVMGSTWLYNVRSNMK